MSRSGEKRATSLWWKMSIYEEYITCSEEKQGRKCENSVIGGSFLVNGQQHDQEFPTKPETYGHVVARSQGKNHYSDDSASSLAR